MHAKSMCFNAGKFQFATVSESTISYVGNSPPNVAQAPIPQTAQLDYLGVSIDDKLTWCANYKQKISKAKQVNWEYYNISKEQDTSRTASKSIT